MSDAQLQVMRQVEQMKTSIIEDAKEKALEIEYKAMCEAEAMKSEQVRRSKDAKDDLFKKEMQAVETELTVKQAKQKKMEEDQVLQTRVNAVKEVKAAAMKTLEDKVLRNPKYGELLQQLTVQGAFVLEGDALISCRPEDKGKINLQAAAKAAEEHLLAAGRPKTITLSFNDQPPSARLAAELQLGGVFLCLEGDSKITCDNTLSSRLGTCMEEYAPILRHNLFQERKIQTA